MILCFGTCEISTFRRHLMGHTLGLLKAFSLASLPPAPHQEAPMVLISPSYPLPSCCTVWGGKEVCERCAFQLICSLLSFQWRRKPLVTVLVLTGIEVITLLCVCWSPALLGRAENLPAHGKRWMHLVFLLPVCMTSALPTKLWIFSLLLFWFSHISHHTFLA